MFNVDKSAPKKTEPQDFGNKKSFADYCALIFSTCGVGYIPLAPGTWGSAVGVVIYFWLIRIEKSAAEFFTLNGGDEVRLTAWNHAFNGILFLLLCLAGVWAADRAAVIFGKKDPQKVVIDEVIGQLAVFLFVPFEISWKLILAGFLLFRLFDIWKPYPVKLLEALPAGLGICADDILAGVYGGVVLSFIYALSFNTLIFFISCFKII